MLRISCATATAKELTVWEHVDYSAHQTDSRNKSSDFWPNSLAATFTLPGHCQTEPKIGCNSTPGASCSPSTHASYQGCHPTSRGAQYTPPVDPLICHVISELISIFWTGCNFDATSTCRHCSRCLSQRRKVANVRGSLEHYGKNISAELCFPDAGSADFSVAHRRVTE